MDRSTALALLRKHRDALRDAGVQHLSLFGSVARGDQGPDSDVDVLAALDASKDLSLLDVVCLERRLSELLGTPVHLTLEPVRKPRLRAAMTKESVRAF